MRHRLHSGELALPEQVVLLKGEAHGFTMTGGWLVREIRIEREPIDITTWGNPTRMVIPGLTRSTAVIEQIDDGSAQDRYEQARELAINKQPLDSREAVEALFDLDDALPEGWEAIAEVCQDRKDGKRFIVKARRVSDEEGD